MLMSVSPVTRLQEAFLMQHFYTEDAAEESRKYRMGKDLPSSPRKKTCRQSKEHASGPAPTEKPQESLTTNCAKSTAGKPDGQDGINTYLIHPVRKRHFRHIPPERFLRKTAELFLFGLGGRLSFLLALLIPVFTGFARRFRTFGAFTGALFPQPHAHRFRQFLIVFPGNLGGPELRQNLHSFVKFFLVTQIPGLFQRSGTGSVFRVLFF
jgi:hypothetical protein